MSTAGADSKDEGALRWSIVVISALPELQSRRRASPVLRLNRLPQGRLCRPSVTLLLIIAASQDAKLSLVGALLGAIGSCGSAQAAALP
jgi:hypothetical protein